MKTILFVDDDFMIRTLFSEFFSEEYKVLLASDGQEGLKLFLENILDIDLVITDLLMPIMNGIEMIKAIRAIPKTTKIMVFSGSGGELDKYLKSEDTRIDKILLKPVDAFAIQKAIKELLPD